MIHQYLRSPYYTQVDLIANSGFGSTFDELLIKKTYLLYILYHLLRYFCIASHETFCPSSLMKLIRAIFLTPFSTVNV